MEEEKEEVVEEEKNEEAQENQENEDIDELRAEEEKFRQNMLREIEERRQRQLDSNDDEIENLEDVKQIMTTTGGAGAVMEMIVKEFRNDG